jgi:hypothetical protein
MMSSFIVLSYGRSGSVLLAHNIGRNLQSLPVYVQEAKELTYPVIHSHLFFSADQTRNYTRVFNLRKDPVETVMSLAIASNNDRYHKMATETLKTTEPFYINPRKIKSLCINLIEWHNTYSPTLTNDDHVIIYEEFVAGLDNPVYDKIYPNKDKIIINYNEVLNECEKYKVDMLASIAPFLHHTNNNQDLDKLIF